MGLIWTDAPDLRAAWRCARLAIGALGIVLVAGLHLFVPFAMLILISLSMVIETRLRGIASGA